jgi:phytoene dehydrogenase-like protein
LVAAGYLARAGLRVRLLERLGQVGGAAVSAQVFDGVEVRVSRYSYLVSLLPSRIVDDLGAAVQLSQRQFSSYTPQPATGGRSGLLIGSHGGHTPDTFAAVGAAGDLRGFAAFYQRCRLVTERIWPTLIEPLRTREQARRHVVAASDPDAAAAWRAMIDEPIGHAIADAVGNDLVRGVIATDALIGTFARVDDPSLRQNICFLYHVLGGGTGDWDVPVGGMGSVTAALATAAVGHGAEIITGADVYAVEPNGQVHYRTGDEQHLIRGRFVLAGVTPAVLAGLLGEEPKPLAQGAQVKVNMVVRRLPRLRDDSVTPEQAFAGTFHANETWTQLDAAY